MLSEFHFLRPYWLLALVPLVWLGWRLFSLHREGGDWQRVCDPALLPHVLIHDGGGKMARRPYWLLLLGGVLAIAALAGPVWERLPTPAFRNQAALVIALDLSRIMNAADLKPSRIERARFKIADILKQRKDGLTALLVYSGDAFTVTPLTDDANTINSQLAALSSDLMPAQGSRADLALELAGRLLSQSGLARGDVLLITNGLNLDKASQAAKELRAQGYRVSVLGAADEEGAPVPLPEGGFLQDSKGNIVISRLAAPALRRLADDGGGVYQKLTPDNADLTALLALFEQQAQSTGKNSGNAGITVEQWQEQGPWLLLLLLPIAALAFRRGYLAALLLIVLPLPEQAQALDWQELWQTPDQRGSQAFQAGDHAGAADAFENPAWKAAAQYKAGRYEDAAELLKGQESADSKYNLGNALARQGRYPEAIAAYEQALKLNPANEDARHNKELVEKTLKDQQKPPRKQNSSEKDQGQENRKDNGRKQEQKRDQEHDQEKGDQSRSQEADQRKDGSSRRENRNGEESDNPEEQAAANGRQKQQKAADEGTEPVGRQAAEQPERPESGQEVQLDAAERKSEDRQASEQWLRRIPDDPGGLLRRKFEYQYKQRQGRQEGKQ